MAFFSSIDIATLHEQAAQCNNVLSIVVNNDGNYVAKFTEKHLVNKNHRITTHTKEHDHWNHMGDKEFDDFRESDNTKTESEKVEEVHIYDAEIERPLNCPIDEEFKQVCLNLQEQKKIEKINKEKEEELVYWTSSKRSFNDVWFQRNFFDDSIDYYDNSDIEVTEMVDSILELSFNPTSLRQRVILTNKLSEDFVNFFMIAWMYYYEPSKNQLKKVRKQFEERTKNCIFPLTRDLTIKCLDSLMKEI